MRLEAAAVATAAGHKTAGRIEGPLLVLLLFLPMALAAAVRLPLFQDGASYLVEIMTDGSAVRHHRYAVLLVQAPAIAALKISAHLGLDPVGQLRWTSALFNAAYALAPAVAMAWSWVLVRDRDRRLMVWPALLLLLNQVNFSSVSEILMAVQFACPLMLAACQSRLRPRDYLTIALLLPVVVTLHALTLLLLLGTAAGLLVRARVGAQTSRMSRRLALLFAAAAIVRLLIDAFTLTDYEHEMLAPPQVAAYFAFSPEAAAFLAALVLLGLAHGVATVRRAPALPPLFVVLAIAGLALAGANVFAAAQRGEAPHAAFATPLIVIAMATAATVRLWRARDVAGWTRTGLVAAWWTAAATTSSWLVLDLFPLKSGTTVAIGALILALIGRDSLLVERADSATWRRLLTANFILLFALMLMGKAATWHSATERLDQARASQGGACVERRQASWLRQPPFTILDNWALPSLSMVSPSAGTTRLVLEAGDCAVLRRDGLLVIDPWSRAPVENLPFVRMPQGEHGQ